jgi:hypothetical protein
LAERCDVTTAKYIEVSVRGEWVPVPVVEVPGATLVLHGRWLSIASVNDEEWLERQVESPESCITALATPRAGLHPDIFTFAQKLPETSPKYPYPMEWDSIAAIRTDNSRQWWETLPQETRKNVRRSAKRGVTVDVASFGDELVRAIADVNDDSPTRQGGPNRHYGKSLQQVRRDHQSFVDRSDFICAFAGGQMIGFIKLVHMGSVAGILNIAVKPSEYDKRPANALIAKAVEICAAKGFSYLVYGKFSYGNKRHGSLLQFKVRNGFGEILVPRYYVPLTAKGRVGMRLGLHRGLIGMLPESLIRAGLGVRKSLYKLKGLRAESRDPR